MATTDALEAFIDESVRLSKKRGYHPYEFERLRDTHQTIPAIERLVKASEIQSGFRRLQTLNMIEWSIESAVLKFPELFTPDAVRCAQFRLNNINDPQLRSCR